MVTFLGCGISKTTKTKLNQWWHVIHNIPLIRVPACFKLTVNTSAWLNPLLVKALYIPTCSRVNFSKCNEELSAEFKSVEFNGLSLYVHLIAG